LFKNRGITWLNKQRKKQIKQNPSDYAVQKESLNFSDSPTEVNSNIVKSTDNDDSYKASLDNQLNAVFKIGSNLDLEKVLYAFALEVSNRVPFDNMWACIIGESQEKLLQYHIFNDEPIRIGSVQMFPVNIGVAQWVINLKQPVTINKVNEDLPKELQQALRLFYSSEIGSCAILPFKETIGAIGLSSNSNYGYTDKNLLALGPLIGQLAISVENSRLYLRAQENAIVEERQRIAREIHDSTAQVLGYLRAKSELIERFLERNDCEKSIQTAQEMQEVANKAYNDVREAIIGLSDKIPQNKSVIEVTKNYIMEFAGRWRIKARLVNELNETPFLSRKVQLEVQRIVQEALANVRKHSRARQAWVKFILKDGNLVMEIEDDGQGCDLDDVPEDSFGFNAMKDRAKSFGGEVIIQSKQGLGTRVIILIPIEAVKMQKV